ncbi:hypothetical protein ASPWEDRAFT_730345 [Aspergillus wentii DTO 134E9]|uniref:NACHT domain-containing protein n=1 Tax=Aspergillus wentii DTO 134E9 TaxID=1073089 RepID=A0A1L9RYV1_ASPWE|nr:uncharacterized protein ASPWEDRAFT_730345 [Aspergillus wentii DTO 134E9]KAI9932530.1 hypothetical protein MW887_008772 [Aspergillus wentii]OJJ40095.1 hypothetical protein ASPWEDRAFT_730345 [Aspergillus wentii DTO 134E9]
MSTVTNRIVQRSNIGFTQGVNYGDNVFYDGNKPELTPKHIALETHKKIKAEWEIAGTCDWLLQENDFQSWRRLETGSSFLWLYGPPGCGKSTLMSRVIESIYEDQTAAGVPGDRINLLYFYVGFGDDNNREKLYRSMLETFWEQAVKKSEARSMNVFGNHSPPELMQDELHKLLASSSLQGDIYMVIDALDQLPQESQYSLIEGLNTLVHKLNLETSRRFRVAISSRYLDGIDQLRVHRLFPLVIKVTPGSNKLDIQRYLDRNLKSKLFDKNPELRKRVFDELNENADGRRVSLSISTVTS